MSDEEDYMSDAFLKAPSDQDVRPGLVRSHKQKRDLELYKKTKEQEKKRPLTKEEREKEARADGLQKPIAENNKGFAMLTKMGFDPGKGLGLGRHGQGRTEPVNIDLKTDKQGLGRKTAVLEVMERKRKMLEERRKKAMSVEDFRASLSEKVQERQTNLDLMKSQRVCYTMDKDLGYDEPDEPWFWPEFSKPEKSESDEEENDTEEQILVELSSKEKLELITMYLRRNHHYCVWCCVKYEDEDDLRDCPGPTRYDHDI